MKKIIIASIFILLLTACTHKSPEAGNGEPLISNEPEDTAPVSPDGAEEETMPNDSTSEDEVSAGLLPPSEEDVANLPDVVSATLKTNQGDIKIELMPDQAPFTVANFLNLARVGFYNEVKFHRLIPDFMIQTGDPNSKDDDWSNDGTGGPGYQFKDEFGDGDKMVIGTVAMANSGPGTNGSQFFIVTAEATPWLNGLHTIFGKVTEGMDVVKAIELMERNQADHPLEDIIIEEIVIE